MKKTFAIILFIFLILSTGCGVKDGDKDTHYKPSEFKHNVAISNANREIRDVENAIISMGYDTPADTVFTTYKDSISKLNEQLTILENTKKQLSEDTDLTKNELKSWTGSYNNTIESVKKSIKDVEKKQADFLK